MAADLERGADVGSALAHPSQPKSGVLPVWLKAGSIIQDAQLHGILLIGECDLKQRGLAMPDRIRKRFLTHVVEHVGDAQRHPDHVSCAACGDANRSSLNQPSRALRQRSKQAVRAGLLRPQHGNTAPGLFVAVPHQFAGQIKLLLELGQLLRHAFANRLQLKADAREAL